MRTISGYFNLLQLPDFQKSQNGIKTGASIPRLDCIGYSGNYQGLEAFKNAKGMMYFNLIQSHNIVDSNSRRQAEFCLCGGKSLNFGSLYKIVGYPQFSFSYPNSSPTIGKERKPNPLYQFRNDLYLMIIRGQYAQIEVFIIEDGKNLHQNLFQNLIDGGLNEEINRLRDITKPLYHYTGMDQIGH